MALSFGVMVCDILLKPVNWDTLDRDCTMIGRLIQTRGGDALNTAVVLPRLGISVTTVGRVRGDLNGRFVLDQCRKLGMDISHVVAGPVYATASSLALIEENRERHFLSDMAIFDEVDDSDLSEKVVESADIVYIGSACSPNWMSQGGLARILRRAKAYGRMTVMDVTINQRFVCSCWMDIFKKVLPYTDVFSPSYEGILAITGCRKTPDISSVFKPMGLACFGTKLGSKGCYTIDFIRGRYTKCLRGIRAVDTTGTSDSFMAGLIAGLVNRLSFLGSTGLAGSITSHNVQHMGMAGGMLPYEDELYIYNHHKKPE